MVEKKVLVTGASRGIGFAIAELFLDKEWTVYANYRDNLNMLSLKKDRLIPIKGDVSKARDVERIFEQMENIDVLINNAGMCQTKIFTEITENDWNQVFDMNLKTSFLCSKAFSKSMIANEKEGCIVNISSMWGITGASCEVHYSAAKAAIIGFTKALAKELGPSGICVNAVAPGVIKTAMNDGLSEEEIEYIIDQTPLGVLGEPRHIAEAVWFLVQNRFITGVVLNVSGGFVI